MIDLAGAVSFHHKVLDGVALRQRVVAHNLANQNTPGYRAMMVPFSSVLAEALDRSGSIDHVDFKVAQDPDATENSSGNTVDVEHEMMLMEENRILNEVFARTAGGTFRAILKAIRGS